MFWIFSFKLLNLNLNSDERKKIVLLCNRSIAAYKSALLVRLLVKSRSRSEGCDDFLRERFYYPLTLSTLSKHPVHSDYFEASTGNWNNHVELGLWADMMLIAPASANTLAKMANGIYDNLLLAIYLSAKCPVVIVPAMDLDMWKHPSTQRNIQQLKKDGVHLIAPADGELQRTLRRRKNGRAGSHIFTIGKFLFTTYP